MAWLKKWEPENTQFWQDGGSAIAWRTLILTTFSLIASFATWFVMSAVVVRMPGLGFKFDTMQLFWLAAMPGLAGGTLRLIHAFLIPIFGTRMTVTTSTFLKLIPMVWLGFAIQDNTTSFNTFMIIAFLCGMCGGDFSSYMPSSSLFFPKRLQGTAMGIQAGIGNFGVSLTQFITPWIIGFAALGAVVGAPQAFNTATVIKDVVVSKSGGVGGLRPVCLLVIDRRLDHQHGVGGGLLLGGDRLLCACLADQLDLLHTTRCGTRRLGHR